MNSTLIAVRDNYRRHAVRTADRLNAQMFVYTNAVAAKPAVAPRRPNVAGFMAARDYYIGAAEAVDGLIDRDGLPSAADLDAVAAEEMAAGRGATDGS